jgi:hypothetical protein
MENQKWTTFCRHQSTQKQVNGQNGYLQLPKPISKYRERYAPLAPKIWADKIVSNNAGGKELGNLLG